MNTNKELSQFGAFIRPLRKAKRITLGEMADNLGISSARLSTVELHEQGVPKDWLGPIREFMELTEDEQKRLAEIHDAYVLKKYASDNPMYLRLVHAINKNKENIDDSGYEKLWQVLMQLVGKPPSGQDQKNVVIP